MFWFNLMIGFSTECFTDFRQATFDNRGSILGLSQFLLLTQLPKKQSSL
jgi:hypothetical protein